MGARDSGLSLQSARVYEKRNGLCGSYDCSRLGIRTLKSLVEWLSETYATIVIILGHFALGIPLALVVHSHFLLAASLLLGSLRAMYF